ncbi:hypothetical protein ACFWC9_40160 [Streptomyces goshikiensis]|uniref:hypothetical protein n=1 Tax=Streptomyces goshikiensis TaxID=1942 RepID=UPI0036748659
MIDELTAHTWIEEKVFDPAAREAAPDTKDRVVESIEERRVVVWTLSEPKGLDPADQRFVAKVSVLMENVRHHAEEKKETGRRSVSVCVLLLRVRVGLDGPTATRL